MTSATMSLLRHRRQMGWWQSGHFLGESSLAAHLPQPEMRMRNFICLAALTATVVVTAVGCGFSNSSPPGTESFAGNGSSPSGSGGGGSFSGPASDSGGAPPLPPEVKVESDYQSPVATGQIVWTANPVSGRVAYIDAKSFNVQTVQAGDGPTYLAAVNPDPSKPPYEAAIVLNVRSHDATLLSRDSGGKLSTTRFLSTSDANSWATSHAGRWAIAWTDASHIANAVPTQGFQDIAVLDLWQGRPPTILAVGYRPSQVVFSPDETRAFVVTEDGISVIDLVGGSQPTVTQNFDLSAPIAVDASAPEAGAVEASAAEASTDDASSDGASSDAPTPDAQAEAAATDAGSGGPIISNASGQPDVSFTTDGAYALVRQEGVAAITVVSLKDGSPTRVTLLSAPTDLALSPDGTFAVAVLRDTSTVAVLPLPGIAANPTSFMTTTIAGETIGRAVVAENLSTKQTSILLFTTVLPVDRLTVLTLQPSPSFRTITLHAPILAVFPTADAQTAVVLHTVVPTAGSDAKGAFSLVPIAQSLPAKIVSLPAPPTAVALADTSDRALITIRDDATSTFAVELAKMPSFEVLPYTLASPPTAVGIAAAAAMGFVAQNYADGRITFIDLALGGTRTITGFELGARVVQGEGGAQ
jgi:hypothetical protein